MKTESLDFNRQLWTFKESLRSFAISFTRNEDDADDLVQDTMLKAVRYAEKFEKGTNLKELVVHDPEEHLYQQLP
jgi:DNA-directed RNA polymerase specialized sigma24 family protein